MNEHIRLATIGSYLTRRQAMRNYARLGRVYADWLARERLPSDHEALLAVVVPPQASWLVKFCDLFERATAI